MVDAAWLFAYCYYFPFFHHHAFMINHVETDAHYPYPNHIFLPPAKPVDANFPHNPTTQTHIFHLSSFSITNKYHHIKTTAPSRFSPHSRAHKHSSFRISNYTLSPPIPSPSSSPPFFIHLSSSFIFFTK